MERSRLQFQEVQVLTLAEHLLTLEPGDVSLDGHPGGALRSHARESRLGRLAEKVAALRLGREGTLKVGEVDCDAVDERVP